MVVRGKEVTPRPTSVHGAHPPPPPQGRPPMVQAIGDQRDINAAHVDVKKVKALREYRRVCSVCFKCGKRWGHDHTCPTSTQIHVVKELLELVGIDNGLNPKVPSALTFQEETAMAISRHALTSGTPTRAIKLHAWLQGHEVLILVDSGSSTSFIDEQLASSLSGFVPLLRPCRVKVVDGGELCCISHIPRCSWTTQAHEFVIDMKVLQLVAYDAILGMEWLEDHKPMNVGWRGKRLFDLHYCRSISVSGT